MIAKDLHANTCHFFFFIVVSVHLALALTRRPSVRGWWLEMERGGLHPIIVSNPEVVTSGSFPGSRGGLSMIMSEWGGSDDTRRQQRNKFLICFAAGNEVPGLGVYLCVHDYVCVHFNFQEHGMIIIVITLVSRHDNVMALAGANGNIMIVALIAGRHVG